MTNPQLQVKRNAFSKNRLVEIPAGEMELSQGDILVKIEKFGYTANNITYAVAGDTIGYWQFFPPVGDDTEGWGVIPVWGFAKVVESKVEAIPVGERLFGYFPPARFLKMQATNVKPHAFVDGTEHRAQLPMTYNRYTRVQQEPGYDSTWDNERMVLWPLHMTAYFLWDNLKENNWYGAEQVVILSASSKTSTGLAYALQADDDAPKIIGITSSHNLSTVQGMQLYDQAISYDNSTTIKNVPTAIVDMSGNQKVMAALHTYLGDHMKFTLRVGLTHWKDGKAQEGIINSRSKFFFAPTQVQKRLKEWGPAQYSQKVNSFLQAAAAKTKSWLQFKTIDGLEELAAIHPAVCEGKIPPNEGLIVEL